jgi:hypothetical protein
VFAGTRDWGAALGAFEEAAEIARDQLYARGEFLDGAALAAQELGRKDLPRRLARAWRQAPSFARLLRWLGSTGGARTVKKRAAHALHACPEHAARQRALLHVLLGDVESAARLLAVAPGLGWSSGDHPGELLFALFGALLAGKGVSVSIAEAHTDDLDMMVPTGDAPRLVTPDVDELLKRAEVSPRPGARETMLVAMRLAAEKRVAGVTAKKRRRHYGRAAKLVLACVALDHTPATARWLARIRDDYRRYPAFRAELDA